MKGERVGTTTHAQAQAYMQNLQLPVYLFYFYFVLSTQRITTGRHQCYLQAGTFRNGVGGLLSRFM